MRKAALIVAVLLVAGLPACADRWMTPQEVASATKACEEAGWGAELHTNPAGQQYVICKGREEAP